MELADSVSPSSTSAAVASPEKRKEKGPKRSDAGPSFLSEPVMFVQNVASMSNLSGSTLRLLDDIVPEASSPGQALSINGRRAVFGLIILLQISANYDSGAVAAALGELQEMYGLNNVLAGLTGSLAYLGLALAALFSGPTLRQPKWVIVIGTLCKTAFLIGFAMSPNRTILLIARFFTGMAQAFGVVVYAPVWVDEFSPAVSSGLWMGLVQAGVPIGIMVGYAVSGFLTANGHNVRLAFYGQAAVVCLFTLLLACVPSKYFNVSRPGSPLRPRNSPQTLEFIKDDDENETESSFMYESWHDDRANGGSRVFVSLFLNGVYIFNVLGLCALFFVVTAMQVWITQYLTEYVQISKHIVVTAFTFTCATAPLMGVLWGGWTLDGLGGYQGSTGTLRAAKMTTGLGVCACICAVTTVFSQPFALIVALVWLLLFFGAAVVLAATGALITSVPPDLRPIASSVGATLFNLLGFFAGPTVVGAVAEGMGGIEWGFRLAMGWSIFGVIMFAASWFVAHQLARSGSNQSDRMSAAKMAASRPTRITRYGREFVSRDDPRNAVLL